MLRRSNNKKSVDVSTVSNSIEHTDKIEEYIIQFLNEDEVQDRIRLLLQSAIKDELSRLSVILREAVRDWIFKEKEKYRLVEKRLTDQDQSSKDSQETIARLQDEVKKLQRQIDLKTHENQVVTSALKKLMKNKG